MGNIPRVIVFSLIIIGTIGLLINEFAFNWGTVATLTFATMNLAGLVILMYFLFYD
ncbi:unnamed protein product, partial [marine sediment metagenome]